jgi:RNA polymerase sigma factor (sigma-70 family)
VFTDETVTVESSEIRLDGTDRSRHAFMRVLPAVAAYEDVAADSVACVRTRSFAEFYNETRPGLVRAVAVSIGNADLANEAVDEAMTRAFASWSRVSRHTNPSGWVYRVAVNWAISFMRRESRRPTSAPPQDAEMPEVVDDAVGRALAALDVKHRSVVVCRHLLGWSEHETADALNLRPGTVKSRLSRASAELRTQLQHLRPEANS